MRGVMDLKTDDLYEFGEYILDKKERILKRGENAVQLSPKAFELLTAFVENPGRLIEKDELMRQIWSDSFVEESNLTFNIGQLRKALGDNPQKPVFIKTVPRYGYRFIAPVEKIARKAGFEARENISTLNQKSDSENEESQEDAAVKNFAPLKSGGEDAPKKSFVKSSFFALIAILSIITAVIAAALVWRKNDSAQVLPILAADYKVEQLTNGGGVDEAAISPNGKLAAYVNEIGGKTSVWIRNLETGENTQLTPNVEEAYYGIAFSRDGQEVYFSRGPKSDEKARIALYRVSVFGGIPKEIIGELTALFGLSPDGKQISFVRCPRRDEEFCALYVADAEGKNERKLLSRPRPIQIRDNKFSPDGKTIAVAVGQSRSSSSEFGLIEVETETGKEREFTDHKFSIIDNLAWLPDGSGLLATAFEPPNNAVQIYRISKRENKVESLTSDATNYDCLSLDDQAKRLIVTQVTDNFRLWIASVSAPDKPATISQAAAPMYFGQSSLVFTENGQIIYTSAADTNQHIWIMNADGSDQRQLTAGKGTNWQPHLSPDRNSIIFASNRTGAVQIWRMKTDGSDQTQISFDNSGIRPIFVSADGKTIYYESPRNSQLGKIVFGENDTASSELISQERVFQPAINSGETLAAYFSRTPDRGFEISLLSLSDGKIVKTLPLADGKSIPVKIVWAKDGKSLFYLAFKEDKRAIWQISPDGGDARIYAELGEENVSDFSFSQDEKTLAFVRGKEFHNAFLIEGFK